MSEDLWVAYERLKAAEARAKRASRDALVSLAIVFAFSLGVLLGGAIEHCDWQLCSTTPIVGGR